MNALPSPREVARLLGGDAAGRRILCPGPGHSHTDRSLSVMLMADGGFIVHSFAGDDWTECRDHVSERLGLADWRQQRPAAPRQPRLAKPFKDDGPTEADRIGWAASIWRAAGDIRGTMAATYLASRGLCLEGDYSHVLRFHPALKLGDTTAPGMVALLRDAITNAPCGVHRTFLDAAGRKLDRKMLGRSKSAAVKLDASADVSLGLHIGEGIETCLAARQLGCRPAWALGSAGAIADFPVLSGIEALTVFTENDEASTRAATVVCDRYEVVSIEAWIIEPPAGDMNDTIRGAA